MKKIMKALAVAAAVVCLLQTSWAQFTEDELTQRDHWEGFLNTAKIIKAEQPWGEKEAVTRPWKLTLQKDGITRYAVWKDCEGNMKGYIQRELALGDRGLPPGQRTRTQHGAPDRGA